MINCTYYKSPIGKIFLFSKENKLIRASFEGQKYFLANINEKIIQEENETLIKTKNWLDDYFIGNEPSVDKLDLNPVGTEFRQEVWKILCEIQYGQTVTYKDIALQIAKKRGMKKMSAQAVGGAVSHNPIAIIIPCHRVIGSDGSLTGYAGGIDKKLFLLKHENPYF